VLCEPPSGRSFRLHPLVSSGGTFSQSRRTDSVTFTPRWPRMGGVADVKSACAYCGTRNSIVREPKIVKQMESAGVQQPCCGICWREKKDHLPNVPRCQYCRSTAVIKRWRRNQAQPTGLRLPCCEACRRRIVTAHISAGGDISDVAVRRVLDEVKGAALGFNTDTRLEALQRLITQTEQLSFVRDIAETDFNRKADQAADAANRLAWIAAELSATRTVIEDRLKINYEHARQVANEAISDSQTREAVFARDDHKCRECGSREWLSIDHVVPVLLGGANEMDNYQTLCVPCNSRKGEKVKEEVAKHEERQ